MSAMDTLDHLINSYLGIPYIWGGDNPLEGFDCSGLACEILRAHGKLDKTDYSAAGLFELFKDNQTKDYKRGCLAFYGKSLTSINHVAVLISPTTIIEAGGGNSECINVDVAAMRGACVRLRPVNYRKDLLVVCHT